MRSTKPNEQELHFALARRDDAEPDAVVSQHRAVNYGFSCLIAPANEVGWITACWQSHAS